MSVSIKYKGSEILNIPSGGDYKLNTSGKYLEDDIRITDSGGGGGTPAVSVVDTLDSHGGTVRTITALDISDTTAIASDVAQGKYFYTADGTKTEGTATGGGSAVTVIDETLPNGATAKHITAVNISNDTVTASHLEQGYTAHDASGNAIVGTMSGGGGVSNFVQGTFNVPTIVNTSTYVKITDITEIGFTPTKFIFIKDIDVNTNNYLHYSSYTAIGAKAFRSRVIYSEQNASLSASNNYSAWNTASTGFLYLSSGNIQIVASSSCILGVGDYTWIAIE